ncbi:MAG: EamA family transporter [Acidobacteria bacterium]|nr:MAG: EamA family transporter [Acidobacteriota bacterium]
MQTLVGVALAVAAALITSLRPVFTKLAYHYMSDPVTLLALRMSLSVPFIIAMIVLRSGDARRVYSLGGRDLVLCASLGFVGYYLSGLFDALGLQYIDAALGRLLLFVCPTLVLVISWTFFDMRPSGRDLMALLVTYIGVAFVLSARLNQDGQTDKSLFLGAFLALLSATSWSIYLIGCDCAVGRIGTIPLVACATVAASVYGVLQFLLTRPLSAVIVPVQVYGIALAMALLNTVMPVFMVAEALRRIGAADVAMISAIGPVVTAVVGYLFLNELMTPRQIVGGILVLIGVLIIGTKGHAVTKGRRPEEETPTGSSCA